MLLWILMYVYDHITWTGSSMHCNRCFAGLFIALILTLQLSIWQVLGLVFFSCGYGLKWQVWCAWYALSFKSYYSDLWSATCSDLCLHVCIWPWNTAGWCLLLVWHAFVAGFLQGEVLGPIQNGIGLWCNMTMWVLQVFILVLFILWSDPDLGFRCI